MAARISSYIVCILLVLWGSSSGAVDYYRTAGNLSVYFGVLPSELMGHSPDHPGKPGHGDATAAKHQHHVVVAVFDTKTGKRITDASVTATLKEHGQPPTTKKLEPMSIAGSVSYSNFFQMSYPFKSRFTITIRPTATQERSVDFEF